VARWPLSRMDNDAVAEADGEFIDLTTRLGRREAELRSVRADQSELRRQLIRAEDRASKLRWQLDSIHASRAYRAFQLLRAARRRPAAGPRLPAGLLRVLTSAGPRPSAPPDPDFRGREEHTLAGWAAYDRRDYQVAIAEAQAILDIFPDDYPALDLMQSAHWQRGDVGLTLITLRRMRAVHDSARLAATVRGYLGRARELDLRWQPRIPGSPHPVEPRDGVIMHLLGESIPYRVNGFTTSSRSTLWCQRQAGLDPFAVTSLGFPRTATASRFAPVEVMEGTPYYRIDPGADYPAAQPRDILLTDTAWLAARVGRQQRPAVIHARAGSQDFGTALVGLALREHLRRPLVCEVRSFHDAAGGDGDTDQAGPGQRGGPSDRGGPGELHAARRASEFRCLQGADLVVTSTDGMRSAVIAGGVPASRVRVIPDAVDTRRFVPGEPSAALRRRWGLTGKSVIGYVSDFEHSREGQEILIDATARLRAGGRDVVCLLVGDGPRRPQLEQLARSAAGDGVIFTGEVPHEQVPDFYSLMDIFVVPRTNDPATRMEAPLTLGEAMALRRPLIVADLPPLVELAQPGERGLAFIPGDPAALADAVTTLLDHPEQATRLADRGRQWVLTERTGAAHGQLYQDVYQELMDRWRPAGQPAGRAGKPT
jgi:Glycosyl transferases group 1/Glycosyl transferase 4-like domain